MSEPELLALFYETRDQYRSNADKAIAAGEYRKASELLWGAITQQLKALAAAQSIIISSHRQFFDFLRELCAERQDMTLYNDFVNLNALHKNFYDETIPPDAFPPFYEKGLSFIARVDDLTKKSP